MTTMDSYLTSKKKEFNVSDLIKHYSNLNLNECSNGSPIHTKSITFNCETGSKIEIKKRTAVLSKVSDLITSSDLQTKKSSWNQSQKNPSPDYLNMLGIFQEKELKGGNEFSSSKNTSSNCTLSLHISAYESSVDDAALDSFGGINDEISNKHETIKNWRNAKLSFIESSWTFQNPFEFPRQQSDKVSEPEVSQFRASQLLYNPNGTNSTTPNEQNVDETSNQIATEENVNESPSHIDTIDTENPFFRCKKGRQDKFVAILQVAESMAEENNFNESNFKEGLNEKCRTSGIKGKDFCNSWKMNIVNVKKRFDERNGKFGNDEDRRYAIIQRKIDPDYCIRQSAAVEKGDLNNGTKQGERRRAPQLKRRRVCFGAAVGENATLRKIVRPNYIRLHPQSVVNGGSQFRRRQTPSNERSEGVFMNESNIVKIKNIDQRTSDPIVVNIDMSPAPSSSLNSNQNGAEFDDVASVHRPSPLPSISSMASATLSRNSSPQNVLMFQQQPTLSDEAAQQQIPSPAPVGQENNHTLATEDPTNPFPNANVSEPAQLQQQQSQQHIQDAQQQEQEVNNFPMLAAEVDRLKTENEYKLQAFRERLKSKMIDKLAEELNP